MNKKTFFSEFVDMCELLQATTKKLKKSAILSDFLIALSIEELPVACLFILGKVFPDYDSRTLDVSWRTLQKILEGAPPSKGGVVSCYFRCKRFFCSNCANFWKRISQEDFRIPAPAF